MGDKNLEDDIMQTVKAALGAVQNGFSSALDQGGVIQNLGLLDLSSARGAEDLAHIRSLRNIGLVLIPADLLAELNKRNLHNVGSVVPIPTGLRVRTFTGQIKLAGDAFDNDSAAQDVLVFTGQVVFTSTVTRINAAGVVVCGQLLAPQSSQSTLASAITQLAGQVLYYPDEGKPRILLGKDSFEQAFFDNLREPETLVLIGNFRFADDVRADAIWDKLAGLVIVGNVTCSRALKPALQARCSECVGTIVAADAATE